MMSIIENIGACREADSAGFLQTLVETLHQTWAADGHSHPPAVYSPLGIEEELYDQTGSTLRLRRCANW